MLQFYRVHFAGKKSKRECCLSYAGCWCWTYPLFTLFITIIVWSFVPFPFTYCLSHKHPQCSFNEISHFSLKSLFKEQFVIKWKIIINNTIPGHLQIQLLVHGKFLTVSKAKEQNSCLQNNIKCMANSTEKRQGFKSIILTEITEVHIVVNQFWLVFFILGPIFLKIPFLKVDSIHKDKHRYTLCKKCNWLLIFGFYIDLLFCGRNVQ